MEIHPVIDKIFQYQDGGIEEFLNEHPSYVLKDIWAKVPY